MIVSEIKLYNLLKSKLGDQEAEAFIQILEERVDKKFEENKDRLSTKEDIYQLREEFATKLGSLEARITMRMFLFWIGQLAAFIAIAKFILLK